MKQILSVENVSQRFDFKRARSIQDRFTRNELQPESFMALENISFSLNQGESLALLGPNGSGKSTLLKVIGGIFRPTEGVVRRRGRLGALLELGAGFHPELTGRENIFLNSAILGLTTKETSKIFDQVVDFSGISTFIDSPVKTYSSGMYVRLGFAIAVHTEPDLLLVDEVLAVGDEQFQTACLKKIREMQADGRSIVLVTHSMETAEEFTEGAVLLDHGKLVYQGRTKEASAAYHKLFAEPIITTGQKSDREKVFITNVNFADVHKVTNEAVVKYGDSLDIQVELQNSGQVTDWSMILEIWTMDGHRIFECSWNSGEFLNSADSAVDRLLIHLDELIIGNGIYRLAIHSGNVKTGERWSDWINALHFEVCDSPFRFGPLPTKGSIAVDAP